VERIISNSTLQNYQQAFWATNGIDIPFTGNNISMQYKPIVAVTVISGGPPATVNFRNNRTWFNYW